MKKLLIAAALFAATSCKIHDGRTIAMGRVDSKAQNYTPFVYNPDNGGEWIEWEPWAITGTYNIAAYPGDTIRAVWIDKLTGDTLATLKVIGGDDKAKILSDLVLNGSAYTIDPSKAREIK